MIRAAAAFAESYQAELSLAYVMEMPPVSMETAFGPYRDDFMAAADGRLVELKKKAGVNALYYESPLTAHEWQSWRRSLYQFAPLLFND